MSGSLREAVERFRKESEADLEGIIEGEIRESIALSTRAWVGVVIGSFVVNLLLINGNTGG